MKTKIYNFYSDPGHGWLKVPMSELVELGIQHKISGYSYIRKGDVFLEEDCDASVFIKAMKERGVTVRFREHIARERSSKIRNYNSYPRSSEYTFSFA